MGVIFAIIAAVLQAVGFVVLKRSYKEFPPSVAFFFITIFGLLVWIPYAFLVGFSFDAFPTVFIYALVSTILAQAFAVYILSKGDISITGSIFATYPIYTVILSFLINKEMLTPAQGLFILLTIVGTIIVSLPDSYNRKDLAKSTLVVWPIVAAIAVGLSDTLSKRIIDQSSPEAFMFALALSQIPVSIVFLRLEKQSIRQFANILTHFSTYRYSILGSFMFTVMLLFLFLSLGFTLASIAAPIFGAYPALLVILAALFLKEKISTKHLAGIIIVLTGVIGVGIFS